MKSDTLLTTSVLPARFATAVLVLLTILLAGPFGGPIFSGGPGALAAEAPEQTAPARRQVLFLPFSVDIPGSHAYLRNGLASMLASRLATRANIIAVPQGAATEQMAAALKAGNHEAFGQQLFQSFGTHALRLQGQAGAVRAGLGPGLAMAAMVADQPAATGMHGHRRALRGGAATRAMRTPAAIVA